MTDQLIKSFIDNIRPERCLISSGTAVTLANSTTETTLISTSFLGQDSVQPNLITPHSIIKLTAFGIYSTIVTPGNLTFKIKFTNSSGTVVTLATVVTSGLLSSATNKMWMLECYIVARSYGASGTVVIGGTLQYEGTVYTIQPVDNGGATSTIDTTLWQKLDLTAQWDTANASKTITCNSILATFIK